MTDLPERPNPRGVEFAQDALAAVTAFAHDDYRTMQRWVAAKVTGGPDEAHHAISGLLSVAGALLVEASRGGESSTVEEVVQRIGLRFAEMESPE